MMIMTDMTKLSRQHNIINVDDLHRAAPGRLDARRIAALRANPRCRARRVFDAAAVDLGELARRLGRPVPQGEPIFAQQRGERFERVVKADGYAPLLRLLADHGHQPAAGRPLSLRELFPLNRRDPAPALERRARATREAVLAMAAGRRSAPSLLDGAAIELDLGGVGARLEADALAWRLRGRLAVVEIKSWPIVSGRADPEKVGAALWQAAVYVFALIELVREAGFDPAAVISQAVVLVAPAEFALRPTAVEVDASRHVAHLQRLLGSWESLTEILAALPRETKLDTSSLSERQAAEHVDLILKGLGTSYQPGCLGFCALAYHCRAQARAAGDPSVLRQDARARLGTVGSLGRALELARKAPPRWGEQEVARELARAHGLLALARDQAPPAGRAA